MPTYRWKDGARVGVDANAAGPVLEGLSNSGCLTPSALVDASRSESAPLHGEFEWNDGIAAEKYRETQAGYIIRSIEIVIEQASEPVRAFVPIRITDDAGYVPIQKVMRQPEYRDEILSRAMAEAKSFRRKYASLKQLAGVFAEIDKLQI